jgi:hypothetical protein
MDFNTGDVLVVDLSSASRGSLKDINVSGTTATVTTVASNLSVGYPAGITQDFNTGVYYVSGLDPVLGTDVVYYIDSSTNPATVTSRSPNGLTPNNYVEAGGLKIDGNNNLDLVDGLANGGSIFNFTP